MSSHHAPYSMAAILAAGGLYGLGKGSRASLVAGLGFASLYAIAGYECQQGQVHYGHTIGLCTSVILASLMEVRYMKTKKVMPAAALAGLGTLAGAYHGYKLYQIYQH